MAKGDIHIIPHNDLIEHEPSEDCICGPEPEILDPKTGESHGRTLYLHASLDGREEHEWTTADKSMS